MKCIKGPICGKQQIQGIIDDLTAKKTGNLVVINNSDKNMQIDMLIDIDA